MALIEHHQPYFTSNDGVGFYRSLSSHLASKKRGDTNSLLYKTGSELTPEKKALLDSISAFESATAGAQQKEELKRLYAKRSKLFKSELEKISLQQSLQSIQQYSAGPRADILKIGLMERWKDQFEYVYPALISSINLNWAKRFIQSKFELSLTNKQQVEDLFKTASFTKEADSYYLGKPIADLSFGARLYTLDSIQKIEDFIVNLRSTFKDKVLLLDIWATWCAPCISDIPNSIKLHKENSDLPIEYIYLCTSSGSDIETWKKRIGMLKPPGNHIFIDDVLLNALRKKLNAEGGFPTYVVIDQKGKVNAKAISFISTMNREQLKMATGIR